jgi:predicted acetyltransferase
MSDFTLAIPADELELGACLAIVSVALHFERDLAERFAGIVGRENFRVVRDASGAIVGGLALHEMGQHFGGQRVAMSGVGAVGIAPEHRSTGAATAMMRLLARELHERGTPISTLYPATVPLYRRAGYELAGSRCEITIPIRRLTARDTQCDGLRIARIDEDCDRKEIESLYCGIARQTAGSLDRGKFSWRRIREPRGEPATGYKVTNARSEVEGYVYLQQKTPPTPHGTLFNLLIGDVQFTTPPAGRALLSFMRQHQSVCDAAILYGTPDHPLFALITERISTATHQFHWMLRITHVINAMQQRGWNPHVQAEVHLDVQDDVIASNAGRYVLRVQNGKVDVQRGGRGDVIIDVRGLASLYTGHLSPHDCLLLGQLHAADHVREARTDLDGLSAMFAGPRPWLSDMF